VKTVVLSKRESSELLQRLHTCWPQGSVPSVKSVKEYVIEDDRRLISANDEVVGVQVGAHILPFVGARQDFLGMFPSVIVDMGAVKFVCNGAKVMRPGITEFSEFKKGDIVIVKDQTHGKVLAAGIALEDSQSAISMDKGYVVENLHYISDTLWEEFKKI
jgi:PUA domain protein